MAGGQQAEAGMTMLLVVPREELLTEGATVLNRAEALGKLGAVLHSAKLAFRIRVVIGDVRTAMGLGDTQVGQQKGDRFGSHRGTTIGGVLRLPCACGTIHID